MKTHMKKAKATYFCAMDNEDNCWGLGATESEAAEDAKQQIEDFNEGEIEVYVCPCTDAFKTWVTEMGGNYDQKFQFVNGVMDVKKKE